MRIKTYTPEQKHVINHMSRNQRKALRRGDREILERLTPTILERFPLIRPRELTPEEADEIEQGRTFHRGWITYWLKDYLRARMRRLMQRKSRKANR